MPDEQEFISVINQHQKIIHKVCAVYMDTPTDREDLFQEITLQAWKSFATFRGEAQFSTWLYRVALNTAITFFRKEKKQPQIFNTEIFPELTEQKNTDEEQLAAMYKAIGELSNIDKALVMLYIEDYSYQEIGDMMGISPNNVAVKMIRIKTKLKDAAKKCYQF